MDKDALKADVARMVKEVMDRIAQAQGPERIELEHLSEFSSDLYHKAQQAETEAQFIAGLTDVQTVLNIGLCGRKPLQGGSDE